MWLPTGVVPKPRHVHQRRFIVSVPKLGLRSSPAAIFPFDLRRQPHAPRRALLIKPRRERLAPQPGVIPAHLLHREPIAPRALARRFVPRFPVWPFGACQTEPLKHLPIFPLRDDIPPQPIVLRQPHQVPRLLVGSAAPRPRPKLPRRDRAEAHRQRLPSGGHRQIERDLVWSAEADKCPGPCKRNLVHP